MRRTFYLRLLIVLWLGLQLQTSHAQNTYFFGSAGLFDQRIPTPEQFLGYPIGSHYTRHDQLVAYLKELARLSDRVKLDIIGKTYEERQQLILTITAPENLRQLETLRREHQQQADPARPVLNSNAPVVVWLGYSVHGNETSSGEAALLTAYYLVASQSTETQEWLKNAIILIDPSLNPDGRDRAANWHNSYKSFPASADPLDKEHIEQWPNGRSNHFLANLNRDWLSATQVESRNRLVYFHQWYPNVHIDFHEMGGNSTYYFEPSPKRTQSPIVPQASYDFNTTLARYHAAALDKIGSFYFTKEQFDNLSPIYGSTYPDFYGAVGVTFEQGSSRGLALETESGILRFPFTIRNHVQTGLATVHGAVAEKKGLFKLQKDFFQSAVEQGKSYAVKQFVFGDSKDQTLTRQLLELLLLHHVKVYELSGNITQGAKVFERGKSYIVPADQPNFRIVHSIFEETAPLTDSLYYDNTSWSLIHAFGLQYARLQTAAARGTEITALPAANSEVSDEANAVAYVLPWSEYNASRALQFLLDKNVLVRAAFKPFSISHKGKTVSFGYGSLVIPVAAQSISADSLRRVLLAASKWSDVSFTATSTGFNPEGIDLGSNNVRTLRKPAVAVLFGTGVNYEEAGQVWFLLNQQLNLEITKLDISNLSRASLSRYTTLVFPSGSFSSIDKNTVARIKSWVAEGGTLILFKNAIEWGVQQELLREKVLIDSSAGRNTERIDYVNQDVTEGARRINGGIFSADVDITNPVAFGLSSRKIFFTKNSQTILAASRNKYGTIAQYDANSYVGGYVAKRNIARINNTAAILVSQEGSGAIVSFADDPTYRSYWHGTDRLFINAIYFGNHLSLGRSFGGGSEEAE